MGSAPDRRPIASLTFDLDAVVLWLTTLKSKSPTTLSRGEFAPRVAVPRLLRLLERRGVRATFYVPGMVAELYPDTVRAVQAGGHEIASHGYAHEWHPKFEPDEERAVIERGIEAVTKVTGEPLRGFRVSGGEMTVSTMAILEELGFEYDSSDMAGDYLPYRARRDPVVERGHWEFGRESTLWELPFNWELDDYPYFTIHPPAKWGVSPPSQVYEIWAGELDYMCDEVPGGVFTLIMHPQIIGRGPRVQMLDRLIGHALDRGVRFLPAGEVVDLLQREDPYFRPVFTEGS